LSVLEIETAEVFAPLLGPARDKVAHGGRGSGKSHFFAGLLIEDSLAEPGEYGEGLRSVCIREMQKDLAQSSKLLLETKLSDFRLGEADGFKVYRDLIATPGDGIIIFKGMNDYTADSIKSLEGFKRGWWEEAQGATPRACRCIARPCALPARRCGGAITPPQVRSGRCDVPRRGDTDRRQGGRANWRDNPWFTAELEQERLDCLRMQPDQYQHIWEGDYVTIAEALITRRR
jgi:phage terminase large subunit